MRDADWWADAWTDGVRAAADETGLKGFPDALPWTAGQVLDLDWMPDRLPASS